MIFRTRSIIDHLKDNCAPFQGRVGGTADEAAAKSQAILNTPTAWVFPISGKGQPNTASTGLHSQLITQFFGVLIAVKNVADATGEAGTDILEPLRDEVHGLIIGWTQDALMNPCNYVLDRGVGYDAKVLRWVDVFSTTYYSRTLR